jgi:hypothetical protein
MRVGLKAIIFCIGSLPMRQNNASKTALMVVFVRRWALATCAQSPFPIPIPSLEQQRKIAEILNTAKQEINFLEKLAKKCRIQKLALMQKLLVGEWRINAAKEVA